MVTTYIVNFTDPERTAFNVNSFTTDGPVAPNTLQLSSTAVRASTGLILYGKGHADYGERIQENLVNLMENFSGSTEPTFPISGQTWFSRNTYVLLGNPRGTGNSIGSPNTADWPGLVYRWIDDSSNANGGTWNVLTNVIIDPTTADQVKTGGAQPATVIDGSFWLDLGPASGAAVGSPATADLYLGVNSSSSNLSAAFLKREMEDLSNVPEDVPITSGDLFGSPPTYFPQKQLKVYDGDAWKNSGAVFTSKAPPQNPAIGDLWYQTQIQGSPPAGSPSGTLGSPAGGVGSPLQGGGGPLSQLFIWARPNPNMTPRWLTTGYLDRSGDVMTGPLSFGLPSSSLFLWEGEGDDAVGPDLRATDNALLTARDNFYIHIRDDGAGSTSAVFEVATGTRLRPPGRSLFQVRHDGVIRSALGSPDAGSPGMGSPNAYKVLILTADANALTNRAYVDDVDDALAALVASNIARLDVAEVAIGLLNTGAGSPVGAGSPGLRFGSPIRPKLNRNADDTMTGVLTINPGSPQAGVFGLDMSNSLIQNVQTPVAPGEAANKGYVDDQFLFGSPSSGSPAVPTQSILQDSIVSNLTLDWTGGSPVGAAGLLTLTQTPSGTRTPAAQVDITASLVHSHDSTAVLHTIDTAYLRDTFFGSPLPGSPSTAGSPFIFSALQSDINNIAQENLNVRVATLEAPTDREILVAGDGFFGSPTGSPITSGSPAGSPLGSPGPNVLRRFSLTEETYQAGLNRLQVYVNGVKQYANERAYQKIQFNTRTDLPNLGRLSTTAPTRLGDGAGSPTFTMQITVDGTEDTLRRSGLQLRTFGEIVDRINSDIAGVTAVWSERDTAIVVYSNTTGINTGAGTSSSINIRDGLGSPNTDLLLALSTTDVADLGSPQGSPVGGAGGVGSPSASYKVGGVSPTAGSAVSTVFKNLAYFEVVDFTVSTLDANFDQTSKSIIFNTVLNAGDVIELLVFPA